MIWLVAFLSCIGLISAETPFNHYVHNQRVIGGHDAKPNTWKWQVSLQYDSYNDGLFYHMCGGSIIDSLYIMTAAHCILSMDASMYRVAVGEYNLYKYDGSEQFIHVETIVVHPGWTEDLGKGNDIALLRLANPVYYNGHVAIAELPTPGEMLPHDFTCYITGWGLMDYGGSIPAILQVSPIAVVEHSICSQPNWWGSIALRSMICAGGDGVISGCQGDSGGPLSCFTDGAWRVHGVVSYGPAGRCNQVFKPTVFTRVSSFLDWIYSVVRSQ
ncbi:chymotrypsin-like elastase family member 2A isoform X2 [Siniperca chuatsi]|uniref:chymotrypsin-like elastase family member 2A isoform X2 n=1 Tax=Siniperca chuatsi TaxID=119488 RepID=UPI001CE1756B|nr:chymotrypsin-like elastase family member 2A isoform X2 [Siniperca chuatsi]